MQNGFSIEQLDRIREILSKTTVQCRKGEVIEHRSQGELIPGVPAMVYKEVFDMPKISQLTADNITMVDLHFITVAVQTDELESYRVEMDDLLLKWPQPDRMAAGPGYMELGGLLNDQGLALQFMALGEVMGYWEVITPKSLGFEGEIGHTMAGQGLVCISGWRPS